MAFNVVASREHGFSRCRKRRPRQPHPSGFAGAQGACRTGTSRPYARPPTRCAIRATRYDDIDDRPRVPPASTTTPHAYCRTVVSFTRRQHCCFVDYSWRLDSVGKCLRQIASCGRPTPSALRAPARFIVSVRFLPNVYSSLPRCVSAPGGGWTLPRALSQQLSRCPGRNMRPDLAISDGGRSAADGDGGAPARSTSPRNRENCRTRGGGSR